jgi:selenide,water dikinase
MVGGSGVGARVNVGTVPVLDGVRDLLEAGIAPRGTHRNLSSIDIVTSWHPDLDEMTRLLMCDAQTSGGLLISVAAHKADLLLDELRAAGVETRTVVGEIIPKESLDGKLIEVLP